MNSNQLANLLILACDNLRGKPLPPRPPAEMQSLWADMHAVEQTVLRLKEQEARAEKAKQAQNEALADRDATAEPAKVG